MKITMKATTILAAIKTVVLWIIKAIVYLIGIVSKVLARRQNRC